MKKLILAFALLFTVAINAQAQNCNCQLVKNFTSTCNSSTKGRFFTVAFTVESATGVTIEVSTQNGTIDGVASKSYNHTPSQTDIHFTYGETVIKPYIEFTVVVKDARGNVICQEKRTTDLLAICGAACGASWASFNSPAQCTHIDGYNPTTMDTILGVHGALMAGPQKVKSYKTVTSKIQRRTLCSGQPKGNWTNFALDAFTNAELGIPYAKNVTPTQVDMVAFNNATDYQLYLKMPKTRLMRGCPEEFRFTLTITVTFEDGCTVTTSKEINYIWK